MNALCCLIFEGPRLSVQAVLDAGLVMLFMNAAVAFCLNVAVVFLIGKTSSLVLTLSGVLKDILLVILSVIIWSTPVTALQMFGYTIALSGLIWYKIGGEQAQAAYQKLTSDDNSAFNRFRRSLWAKIGAGLLVLFVLSAMAHGFSRGRGIDTAATHTGLTGVPEPEMVDAVNPEDYISSENGDYDVWDKVNAPATHYTDGTAAVEDPMYHTGDVPGADVHHTGDVPSADVHHIGDVSSADVHHLSEVPSSHPHIQPLDIVIYVPPTSVMNDTLNTFREVTSLPGISALNPSVISYASEYFTDLPSSQSVALGTINSPSAAFLHYISNHYDTLAQHTLFLHTDVDTSHISHAIATRFNPHSGVVELGQDGYRDCVCTECIDTFTSATGHLSKTDELYSLTNNKICSATDRLLVLSPCNRF
jgi:hypothetical protein